MPLLGIKSWTHFAIQAGLRDTVAFAACMSDPANARYIDLGLAAAQMHEVSSTPTILINGWRYEVPPSDSQLVHGIQRILEGKPPR